MERPAAAPPAPWPPRFYEHLKNTALGKAHPQPTRRPLSMAQLPSDRRVQAPQPAATEAVMAATRVEAKARLRFGVAQALAQGRIAFHYQPVVQARNPRIPAFFEMLARLRMPDGQVLPAGAFLPAVEAGPLGRAIDRLALAHALKALRGRPGAAALGQHVAALDGRRAVAGDRSPRRPRGSGACGRLILEITEDAAMRGRRPDHRLHGPRARRPAAPSRSTTSAPAPPASSTSATSASTWSRSTAPSSTACTRPATPRCWSSA